MSLMIDGQLRDEDWLEKESNEGAFERMASTFRDWIDGAAGREHISAKGRYPAASGRYHLYVSLACPWAHRTLIYRRLKGLEEHIGVSVVHPYMGPEGWSFDHGEGVVPDPVFGVDHLYELYARAEPQFTGIVTVPVLLDQVSGQIVNNESSEIIRMLGRSFDHITGDSLDFYPEDLREEIDAINDEIYDNVNNGVYRCGFARSQAAYDDAFDALFATLDRLEERLTDQPYLCGDRLTEADWRLFTTLIRFDPVYLTHFKCNRQRLTEYPALWAYTRLLYQRPGIAETVDLEHIRNHYYRSHPQLNPAGIVPGGPRIDLDTPHGRPLGDIPDSLRLPDEK
ncbi:MAG: glutathione S-transferase family protein [Thioalkalivibrionaceae bacterium]